MILELRTELVEGRTVIPKVGKVVESGRVHRPYFVLDGHGVAVDAVTQYLRDLALNDNSADTCRSYGYDLLRWFRLLWLLDVGWEKATESEVSTMVGWLRTAPNPQRRRLRPDSPPAGSVNLKTGKLYLPPGYAPRTINHALTVVHGFYDFHCSFGRGPVTNPVPANKDRRSALAHRSPLEAKQQYRRARLRQKVPKAAPRSIPDGQWDELAASLNCDRDRALMECYVSSGARAKELLGIELDDVDWHGQRIYVVSKGTREREPVPASPEAFLLLAAYLEEAGLPKPGEKLWRTQHGQVKALTYSGMRRMLQRVNARLGTNWTLHDVRHIVSA